MRSFVLYTKNQMIENFGCGSFAPAPEIFQDLCKEK